jgi:hypothetical protein
VQLPIQIKNSFSSLMHEKQSCNIATRVTEQQNIKQIFKNTNKCQYNTEATERNPVE